MVEGNLKKVLVMGIGGHGWKSIKDFLLTYKGVIEIVMLPVDWGGSTGVVGRVLEYSNGLLNKQLHGSKDFPVLPFGDLNKFVADFLEDCCGDNILISNGLRTKNVLDFRSDDKIELIKAFLAVKKCLKLENSWGVEFESYVEKYLDYYNKISSQLDYTSQTSLGNLWHAFLYWKLKSIEGIIDFYHKKNILPQNLFVKFTNNHRLILKGVFVNENRQVNLLTGEDLIDISSHPINPESMILVDKTGLKSDVDEKILNLLKESELIIIPNGSIANWLPIVNVKKVRQVLQKKSDRQEILMLMNLFFGRNEYPCDVYGYYLKDQGVDPVVLAPKEVPEEFYYSFVREYRLQGKNINYNLNTSAQTGLGEYVRGYNNCLELITSKDDKSVEGLKHDQQSVRKEILKYVMYLYFKDMIS